MPTALSGQLSHDGSTAMLFTEASEAGQQHTSSSSSSRAAPSNCSLPPSAATAVLERADKKVPLFCDAVRKFLRQYTAAAVAAQRARAEAAAAGGGGKKGKKKGAGKKKDAGGKKKGKDPPAEYEPWMNFLEELNRKTTSGSVKVDDFPLYVSYLAPHELRGLSAACAVVGKKTFPDNFDEKLAVLRETVRMAAAGFMHRQPGGALERAASGKTVEQLVKEGAAPDDLRRCGEGGLSSVHLYYQSDAAE
jgi:hypothetical protein